jgi:hypothetical protein
LVIPASLLAWLAVLLIGIVAHGYAEKALCPPDDLVSGFCDNATAQAKLEVLFFAIAALSAIAVVGASVAMAPTNKSAVAWTAVAIGSLVAFMLAGVSVVWLSAVVAGTLAAVAATVYPLRPNPSINTDAAR